MSDYFFYDLNKKMADLASKQQLSESAQTDPLSTRPGMFRAKADMDNRMTTAGQPTSGEKRIQSYLKHTMQRTKKQGGLSGPKGNLPEDTMAEAAADYSAKKAAAGKDIGKPGKNFSKIAADAGKRYGSKAAGERVAGAVLNKLRHPSEGVDESALQAAFGMKKYGKPGMEKLQQLGRGGASEKTKAAARKKFNKYDESMDMADERTKPALQIINDYDEVVMEFDHLPGRLKDALQGSDFGAVQWLADLSKKHHDIDMSTIEKMIFKNGHVIDVQQYMDDLDEGNAFSKAVVDAKRDGIQPGEKIRVGGKSYPVKEEGGGIPQTPKQKAFAKLAPPVDKITFADRIVGAKKEVDEVLGDVAASAMKKAVGQIDWTDDDRGRRRSSTGGRIDSTTPGVTRHSAGQRYSGAGHDVSVDDEPTGAVGRRKVGAGQGKKIGAKINRGTSKLMTREGDMPEDMIEPHDSGEYDREGEMAKNDIKTVVRHAQALQKILGDNDNLPEWVQAKLAKIEGMMTAVDDYMQNQKSGDMETESTGSFSSGATNPSNPTPAEWAELKRKAAAGDARAQAYVKQGMKRLGSEKYEPGTGDQTGNVAARTGTNLSPSAAGAGRGGAMDEESTNKRDNRAERAGKKVAKDIEYDEKKKDGIHGQRRDSEDAKAERAGKKVTKDIEYDEKKPKKKKEVDETTTSGSVATGGAAPKSSGGHSYGKGIYDSMNRDVEKMISESMSINMSMNNDSHGGPSNTLTVTATDEDAKMLAGLLKMAGLGHGDDHIHAMTGDDSDMHAIHGMDHEETCPACGSTDCGCDDEVMGEAYGDTDATDNEPDWPTDEEGTDDAMMYSGGLNGPKSTGQTTIPVIAHQSDRMGYEGDQALRRIREMAGLIEATATPQAVDEPTNTKFKPEAPGSLIKVDPNKAPTTKAAIPAAKAVPKIATPQAVDEPVSKVKESLLMQLRNFKY